MKSNTPIYHHDCSNCQYLGSNQRYDYYTCPQQGIRTYIARYGNDPWEYTSAPIDILHGGFTNYPSDLPEAEAYRRYKATINKY